jgi:sulfite reductase (NADPH) flavoprotein alpha-component
MDNKGGGLTEEQKELLKKLVSSLTKDQLTWLGGYFTAMGEEKTAFDKTKKPDWRLFYASTSGNALWVAEEAKRLFDLNGIMLEIIDLKDYKPKEIENEKKALFVISTHGEGEPPYAAESFYAYIHDNEPDLQKLRFTLLALGDSSYLKFCHAGRDIDKRLETLGANRFYERCDCDQEYETTANE